MTPDTETTEVHGEQEPPVLVLRVAGDTGAGPTLTVEGELDASTVGPFDAAVGELLSTSATAVRIDARGVTFIDSSGIRALLTAHERAERAGVGLVVDPASAVVTRLLRLAGVPWLLEPDGPPDP
jgi:anti-anti-sigma factor